MLSWRLEDKNTHSPVFFEEAALQKWSTSRRVIRMPFDVLLTHPENISPPVKASRPADVRSDAECCSLEASADPATPSTTGGGVGGDWSRAAVMLRCCFWSYWQPNPQGVWGPHETIWEKFSLSELVHHLPVVLSSLWGMLISWKTVLQRHLML